MQALGLLPNARIGGYSVASAAANSGLYLRGIKLGYNDIPGDLATNIITAELDGVPLNDLIRNTSWQSAQAPVAALLQGVDVVPSPGEASSRWYDSLGGNIDFIPWQPTARAGSKAALSGGSFGTAVASVVHTTGLHEGWSSVLAAAGTRSRSPRAGADSPPSRMLQAYVKTRRALEHGTLSLGAFGMRDREYSPAPIPVSLSEARANGIDLAGLDAGGLPYSQPSAGFDATLPSSLWQQESSLQSTLYWARLHLRLAQGISLSDLAWLHGSRVDHALQDGFSATSRIGVASSSYSRTLGDKLDFAMDLGRTQRLEWGGYFIIARSQASEVGYTPRAGISLDGGGVAAGDVTQLSMPSTRNRFWALFLQDRVHVAPRMRVVPGLRLVGFQTEFHNASAGLASALGVGSAQADPSPDVSSHRSRLEPSLDVDLRLSGRLRAHASYAVAFHNPDLENYDTGMAVAPDLATLQLLRARSIDAGLAYRSPRWHGLRELEASLDLFQTRLSGQTIGYTDPANPSQTTFGAGTSTLQGIEARASAALGRPWKGFINLGWMRSRWDSYTNYDTATSFAGLPVSNVPEFTASAGIRYRRLLRNGVLDTTLWEQVLGPYHLFDNQVVGPSTRSAAGHALMNLKLRYSSTGLARLVPGAQIASITLRVDNLLDRRYDAAEYISSGALLQTPAGGYLLAYPGAPRALYLTVSADF